MSFFKLKDSVSALKLANKLSVEFIGDDFDIVGIKALDDADEGEISFLDNQKYLKQLQASKACAVIITGELKDRAEGKCKFVSNNPYVTYALALDYLYEDIGASITGNYEIGQGTEVDTGAIIYDGVKIGKNCKIYAGAVISHSIIGDNVTIHRNASIGQDGFGYAFNKANFTHEKVPQIGSVVIEDNVEIGANVTIDRGSLKDTIIGAGTKVDNLVQIAHNVEIGKGCILVSQSGVSGSTKIGDFSVIGGKVGIAGHLNIGSQVTIAGNAGVTKNIADGQTVAGFPAMDIKKWRKQIVRDRKGL